MNDCSCPQAIAKPAPTSLDAGRTPPAAQPLEAASHPVIRRPAARPQPSALSQREQQVLELLARGHRYAEVSYLLGISLATVQTHIKSLYGKLAVHSRAEAVFEAHKLGLLPRDLLAPRD
jgi:DNA-binding CsgD family transcriptional regulator